MPERRFILKEYAPQIAQKRGGQLSQRIRSCSSFRTLRLLLAVVLLGSFAPLNPTAAQQGEPQAMTLYSGVPEGYPTPTG